MRRERDQAHWRRGRSASTPTRSRRCGPSCAIAARGEQPRFRDGDAEPDRRLPRPQGQRARAPLPVAHRRGDGQPARAVRAGLRPDRGGRAGRALREIDEAEAEDFLLHKDVAAAGLTRLPGVNCVSCGARSLAAERRVARTLAGRWRPHRGAGRRLEGDPGRARGDAALLADLEAGASRRRGRRSRPRPTEEATFLSPLDPVSARGRAKPLFGFDYVWEVYKPVEKRKFGYYTMPILWGDRLVARFDPKLDRTTSTLVILGLWLEDQALARDVAFAEAMARGIGPLRRTPRRAQARRLGRAPVSAPIETGPAYSGSVITFSRSRRIAAAPERIWPFVDDVTRWPEWFTEAERCEVLSGAGVGAAAADVWARTRQGHRDRLGRRRLPGAHAPSLAPRGGARRGQARVGGLREGRDGIGRDRAGRRRLARDVPARSRARSLLNTFMLRVMAPRPIGRSFATSLDRLAALAETPL